MVDYIAEFEPKVDIMVLLGKVFEGILVRDLQDVLVGEIYGVLRYILQVSRVLNYLLKPFKIKIDAINLINIAILLDVVDQFPNGLYFIICQHKFLIISGDASCIVILVVGLKRSIQGLKV